MTSLNPQQFEQLSMFMKAGDLSFLELNQMTNAPGYPWNSPAWRNRRRS